MITVRRLERAAAPLRCHRRLLTTALLVAARAIEFASGDAIEALVSFTNNGDEPFVLISIDGSLHYPQDFRYIIQNFTMARYNISVAPGVQQTLQYVFEPDASLDARQLGMVIQLYYTNENEAFRDAVFNATIDIVNKDSKFDGEAFFLYVALAGLATLLLFGVSRVVSGGHKHQGRSSAATKRTVELGTKSAVVNSEWLENTSADPRLAAQGVRARVPSHAAR